MIFSRFVLDIDNENMCVCVCVCVCVCGGGGGGGGRRWATDQIAKGQITQAKKTAKQTVELSVI